MNNNIKKKNEEEQKKSIIINFRQALEFMVRHKLPAETEKIESRRVHDNLLSEDYEFARKRLWTLIEEGDIELYGIEGSITIVNPLIEYPDGSILRVVTDTSRANETTIEDIYFNCTFEGEDYRSDYPKNQIPYTTQYWHPLKREELEKGLGCAERQLIPFMEIKNNFTENDVDWERSIIAKGVDVLELDGDYNVETYGYAYIITNYNKFREALSKTMSTLERERQTREIVAFAFEKFPEPINATNAAKQIQQECDYDLDETTIARYLHQADKNHFTKYKDKGKPRTQKTQNRIDSVAKNADSSEKITKKGSFSYKSFAI